ncbi:ACP S-malonyltransferase [Helicobacter sp. MIT 14-3879]|uniref:ACP S-malonyltransferase n=1 Tax=Helicobacter sp. MIT 14-3879 TaxID=2040649 RepID=UPI000E1E54B7|nr:ACP S-malonyltransferase [Helicobacter sp. MIT 14-3879]RDU61556.1 malonyl CoA-acyl carrier protein transacylase [Helicobacter sp. MIT 14-3879]
MVNSNLAFIYPGQGSQSLGMGKDFKINFTIAKELSQRASDCLHVDMDKILDTDEEKLNQTQYTQPAIFLVSAMAHEILKLEYDVVPRLCFGHSLGEVSAYCLNGTTSFEEAIILTHKRGIFMSQACRGGFKLECGYDNSDIVSVDKSNNSEVGMLVCLGLNAQVIETLCQGFREEGLCVWAANYNLETQIVLAGVKKDLIVAEQQLKDFGAKRTLLLKMNVASHCPLLTDAIPPFREVLESSIQDSAIQVISNATLELYHTKKQALHFLTEQLIKPVLYYKSVLEAKKMGITQFIELGHGAVLAGLNNKISDIPTISINNAESLKLLEKIL